MLIMNIFQIFNAMNKLGKFQWLIVFRCGPSDTGFEQIEPVLLNHKYSGDAGVMVFTIYMQLIIQPYVQ